ncbi:FHA domain-containing protein [Guggenheimella bovis]
MEQFITTIEELLHAPIIGNIDLYTIFSSILRYVFVFIVLYFIYLIVRMIYLDLQQTMLVPSEGDAILLIIHRKDQMLFGLRREYLLSDNESIGRSGVNTIALPSGYLSKKHAHLFEEDGNWYINDLDSQNGTFVNGKRVTSPTVIHDKDIISFAGLETLFLLEQSNE